jgi:hypothetical protein
MTKDEIQLWMLVAFIFALAISSYKVYMIFTKPLPGLDSKTQHRQLQAIILDVLRGLDSKDITAQELFALLQGLDELQDDTYKNFNLNRLHQLLQQLYYTYQVSSLYELIATVQHDT